MKIVVIGLGSMGKRRIRLMKSMYPDNIVFGVDGRRDRIKETEELFHMNCYDSLSKIPEEVDCAFVCTSPLSHASLISDCLEKGWHVFSELNLVDDGYEDNIRKAEKLRKTLFLSSTFLYREETEYIRSRISADRKWNYIYHIGQYLPDWHPWENYRDFFVGEQRTNGCREILAIELPWLTTAFGGIKEIHATSDKMTGLGISYNDNYLIQISHANGNKGCLVVDVVSPCAVRKFEAYAEMRYISWEGKPDSLREFNTDTKTLQSVSLNEAEEHQEGYQAFVVENAYRNEIRAFFDIVSGKSEGFYGFREDQEILKHIDLLGA